MMLMLKLGGIPLLASKQTTRKLAYKHNPHGIFELQGINRILPRLHASATRGRAVKVVAPYIHLTPLDRPVKMIFMTRNVREIIASLLVQKTIWKFTPEVILEAAQDFIRDNQLDVLYVGYHDMMSSPRGIAVRVAHFLERDLDIDSMVTAVDRKVRKLSDTIGPKESGELVRFDLDLTKVTSN